MKRTFTLAFAALTALSGLGIAQQNADPLRGKVLAQTEKPQLPRSTDSSRSTTLCTPPRQTVVGWWPFEEQMGPNADDIAKSQKYGSFGLQQNLGTYAPGGASPTPTASGRVGWALSFDGIDDFVMVTDASEVDLSNRRPPVPYKFCSGFTIDAWIKTSQSTGLTVILDKRVNQNAPLGYHLALSNGRLAFQLADGTPPGSACGPQNTNPCSNYVAPLSSPNVADGNWHLIAVTVQVHGSVSNDTTCPEVGKLYVDDASGQMIPVLTFVPRTHNLPASDIANSGDLYIGRRAPDFGNPGFFKGLIDELEFYNHANYGSGPGGSDGALTQAQLQAIYDAGSAGKCKVP